MTEHNPTKTRAGYTARPRYNSNGEIAEAVWRAGEKVALSPRQLGALIEFAQMTNSMILNVSHGNVRLALEKIAATNETAAGELQS